MTNTTRRSTFMALMGIVTTVVALTVPGTPGGAADGDPPLPEPTQPTVTVPDAEDPVDPDRAAADSAATVQGQVDEATGNTTTSSSTTTTSTPVTTTTTPVTSTTAPAEEKTDDTTTKTAKESGDKAAATTTEVSGWEGFVFEDLPPLPPPPVEIPLISAFRMDEAYAGYTPVGGRRSTQDLFDTLARIDADDAKKRDIVAPFPVYGVANYSDDWGYPRYTPYPHQHEGCDIFAAHGTPVIAPMQSVVRSISPNTGAGGNAVYLALPDGTYLYFAHLDTIADGLRPGQVVEPGTVIGTVGDTGNAEGGTPHLHFEIHPGGGEAVPPVTYLDAWLASANAEANALAGTGTVTPSAALVQSGAGAAAAPGNPLYSTLARSDGAPGVDPTGIVILVAFALVLGGRHHLRSRRSVQAAMAMAGGATARPEPVLAETVKLGRHVIVRHRAEGLAKLLDDRRPAVTPAVPRRPLAKLPTKVSNLLRREGTGRRMSKKAPTPENTPTR